MEDQKSMWNILNAINIDFHKKGYILYILLAICTQHV